MDGDDQYTGICYGENFRGILAQRGQKVVIGKDHKPKVVEQFGDSAELAKVIKKHDWNEYDIVARGNHIIEKINGQLMCEVTDEDSRGPQRRHHRPANPPGPADEGAIPQPPA